MTDIGYARVSTKDQHLEGQVDRLKAAGCGKVFTDVGSGKLARRPGWDECRASLAAGDVLVAVKLDRFGRSVIHLHEVAEDLKERGIGLKCLDQDIDTKSAQGKAFYGMLAVFAAFERDMIVERTYDGLAAARAAGHYGGRPVKVTPAMASQAHTLIDAGTSAAAVARSFGVSRAALYRAFAREPSSAGA